MHIPTLRPRPQAALLLLGTPPEVAALRKDLAPSPGWVLASPEDDLEDCLPRGVPILAVGTLGFPGTRTWLEGPALALRRRGHLVVVLMLEPLEVSTMGWKDRLRWEGAACFGILPDPPPDKPHLRPEGRGMGGLRAFARFWMAAFEGWTPADRRRLQTILEGGYGCRAFLGDPCGDAAGALRAAGVCRHGSWDPEHLWTFLRVPKGGPDSIHLEAATRAWATGFPGTRSVATSLLPGRGSEVQAMVVAWP